MSITSKHIELEGMANTRDLGGMVTQDGRAIKSGLLYRSGHLHKATASDIKTLSALIDLDIDFRTVAEKSQQPDVRIDGVDLIEIPILDEREEIEGVARDYDSIEKVFQDMQIDPNAGDRHMISIYKSMITNEVSVAGYTRFVKELASHKGKGLLWHCSAGKDRCGFATIIVLEILGVSRENIYEDYLMTNVYNKDDAEAIVNRFIHRFSVTDPLLKKGFKDFWAAKKEFLDEMYKRAEEVYGTFDSYLEMALGVTDDIREKIKDKYLV